MQPQLAEFVGVAAAAASLYAAQSKTIIPHFTYVDECDVTELVRLRASLREPFEKHGHYINMTDKYVTRDGRQAERQLGIVDAHGRGATFTGAECMTWAGTGVLWSIAAGLPQAVGLQAARAAWKAYACEERERRHPARDIAQEICLRS